MRAAGRSQLVVGMILAWSVIYLIHVFVFPVYEGAGGSRVSSGGSLAALEGALCGRRRAPTVPIVRNGRTRRACPSAGIATAWPSGRTGNLISEYASLWAVAKRTALEAYAPPCLLAPLSELFTNLSLASLARVRHCRARWSSVVHDPRAWNRSSQALILPAYTFLPDEIVSSLPTLRRELTLIPSLRDYAQAILRELAEHSVRRPVFVGLHVRRTDYARYLRRTLNVAPAPISFYLEAMRHFEQQFPNALFVVVSDEPSWCKQHLVRGRGDRVRVVSEEGVEIVADDEEERARQDLAVLAACNHTIFDYGTFGFWGALLAGGQAVIYHVSAAHSAVRVAHSLPGWKLIPHQPSTTLPPPPKHSATGDTSADVRAFMRT